MAASNPSPAPASGRPGRNQALDKARGLAVCAMVAYHLTWDLSALRLIEPEITRDPAWNLFARGIAGSFLILSGIALVLAHGRHLRLAAFAKRFAVLAGAAGAVTVGTWFVFPQSFVFFGILHALAVSSVIALPFLRAPAWVPAVAALAIGTVAAWGASPIFDAPALLPLGLGTVAPNTNDYVPIFPWTGFLLAGVALGRAGIARGGSVDAAPSRAGRGLAAIGRHSLLIYLLHQPILFGALSAWAAVSGPNPQAEAAPFRRTCLAGCTGAGQSEATCRPACGCVEDALKREALWTAVIRDRLSPGDTNRVRAIANLCLSP